MASLSKSTYLMGLQCPKLLWHRYNAKELLQQPGTLAQAIFDQGHEVGAWAKRLFPTGIEIAPGVTDFDIVCAETQRQLVVRQPLFEPAFRAAGGYARIDILSPVDGDAWDIIEIKSSASVKDVYLEDVAFQAYVCTAAGLTIRRCYVLHINFSYVRQGEVDPQQLFTQVDVTRKVSALSGKIEDKVNAFAKVVRAAEHPAVNIGPHCNSPYECPLTNRCWAFLPEHNVMTLSRGTKKGFQLLVQGINAITDIPDTARLSRVQSIQKRAVVTKEPQIEPAQIKAFLGRLKYPLHYLDFETMGSAVPLFDGSRPFEQIPFQFSLHIVRQPGAEPEHRSFLAEGREDPRPCFMAALVEAIEPTGSLIAYNAPFEWGVLTGCANLLPQHADWVQSLQPRIIDLLEPFRKFHCYHPAQHGSASIKAVLPALTGKNYSQLAIGEGGTASLEFVRVTFTDVSAEERARVRRHLEEYCQLDTLAMVWLVEKLQELAG
ncbi:MAG: DUF2779 domain-containing protein [Acidobacteriia bacterium]|nr:DUF2779 domain-containing protein [Terriglobia bacterium]